MEAHNTLAEICRDKMEHVRKSRRAAPESRLLDETRHASPPRGFRAQLQKSAEMPGFGLIAEIKKASPSKGLIRADFNPAQLAEAYTEGGAACLSVLTDEPYFQGHDDYLRQARAACQLPCLRKDFMLDPYQIVESRALGADCVLLIMAALGDTQARELMSAARSLSLDVLVEVHNEYELDRACVHLEPDMVGINNRDLKTFITDLDVSMRVSRYIPPDILRVSESGISEHADLLYLSGCGIRAFLVGESLMRKENVALATRELLGKDHVKP